MRIRTGSLIVTLLAAALLLAVSVAPAMAADITIPVGKTQHMTDNLDVRFIQVTIAPVSHAQTYTEHPEERIFPILVYRYVNVGTKGEIGHLTIKFTDDQGTEYKTTDPGTMVPINPGTESEDRYLEVDIPKDRKIVKFTVVKGFDEFDYPLTYPGPTATPVQQATVTPTGQPTPSPTPQKLCLGSMILPLLAVGAVFVGRRYVK